MGLNLAIGPFFLAIARFDGNAVWSILLLQVAPLYSSLAGLQVAAQYLSERVKLDWRREITRELHRLYWQGKVAFLLESVDKRIDNADQRLTRDVEDFVEASGSLLLGGFVMGSGLAYPVLLALFSSYITFQAISSATPLLTSFAYAGGSMIIIFVASLPVAIAVFRVNEWEGSFRFHHARCRDTAESIAAYGGHTREHAAASANFSVLFKRARTLFGRVFCLSLTTTFLMGASPILAFVLIASTLMADGFLTPGSAIDESTIQNATSTLANLIMTLTAIPSLLGAAGAVAGITHRVSQLLEGMDELIEAEKAVSRSQACLADASDSHPAKPLGTAGFGSKFSPSTHASDSVDRKRSELSLSNLTAFAPDGRLIVQNLSLRLGNGADVEDGPAVVRAEKAAAPSSDDTCAVPVGCVNEASLALSRLQHRSVLIMGASGVGKSSLLRVIAGLWPQESGRIIRPSDVMILPQVPLLGPGTLQDQVTYPTRLPPLSGLEVDSVSVMFVDRDEPGATLTRRRRGGSTESLVRDVEELARDHAVAMGAAAEGGSAAAPGSAAGQLSVVDGSLHVAGGGVVSTPCCAVLDCGCCCGRPWAPGRDPRDASSLFAGDVMELPGQSPAQSARSPDLRAAKSRLEAILADLGLGHLLERPGGLQCSANWADSLSGGEQQRISLARALFHRPALIVADEATSALDLELEERVLGLLHGSGAALLSVGHRLSLLRYHEKVLSLEGDGSWRLVPSEEFMAEMGVSPEALHMASSVMIGKQSDTALLPASDASLSAADAAGVAGAAEVPVPAVALTVKDATVGLTELDELAGLSTGAAAARVSIDCDLLARFTRLWTIGFPSCCSCSAIVLMVAVVTNVLAASASAANALVQGRLAGAVLDPGLVLHANVTAAQAVNAQATLWNAVVLYAAIVVILAVFSSGSLWLGNILALFWARAITDELHNRYFHDGRTVFAANVLAAKVDGIDQRLATDPLLMTDAFAFVFFGNSRRVGLVEVLITAAFGFAVALQYGWQPALVGGTVAVLLTLTTVLLSRVIVPFRYAVSAAEGDFRFGHARARTYTESVAFFNASKLEHVASEQRFGRTYSARLSAIWAEMPVRAISTLAFVLIPFVSYMAFAWLVLSIEEIPGAGPSPTPGEAFQATLTATASVGMAMQKLAKVSGYIGDAAEAAALIHRVSHLMDLLDACDSIFKRFDSRTPPPLLNADDVIQSDAVSLVVPGGKVLADSLSLSVRRGEPLLVVGPSGCGKTTLLRALGGLWPYSRGTITRPPMVKAALITDVGSRMDTGAAGAGAASVFWVPQQPYVFSGSLRDNILYPHLRQHQTCTDRDLLALVDSVGLGYLLDRVDAGADPTRAGAIDDDASATLPAGLAAALLPEASTVESGVAGESGPSASAYLGIGPSRAGDPLAMGEVVCDDDDSEAASVASTDESAGLLSSGAAGVTPQAARLQWAALAAEKAAQRGAEHQRLPRGDKARFGALSSAPGAGLDAHADWVSTLSLGEVQRLGFLRLCYHKPVFALLDEATSALDVASETRCMELVAARGITVISVAHRLTAPAFHKNILRMSPSASPVFAANPAWVPPSSSIDA